MFSSDYDAILYEQMRHFWGSHPQNIDACEQAVLAVNYPALREALSRHFSEVSHQAAQGRVGLVKKTRQPTRSMAKSGGGALPRTGA